MADSLDVIHFAVSLGHHRSLIYWIDTNDMLATSFKLAGAQAARYREFAGDGLFRLSVGLEGRGGHLRRSGPGAPLAG